MHLGVVIPARGGSKSIPLKNIQLLKDKPMIAYTIEYAKRSSLVKRVIVSTDHSGIAKVAEEHGADVPFLRPESIAGDDVQDFPVIAHALDEMEKYYREQFDAIVWLRPTSPLRPEGLIERAIQILHDHPECTSVRSVVPSEEHPYRQWSLDGDYMTAFVGTEKEPFNLPRQQLPQLYFQSGDIEVARRQTILDGSISGERVAPLIISRDEMVDIDYIEDLEMAEARLAQK